MAGKIQQKVAAVEKIHITRKLLKQKIEQFKMEKENIQPLVGKITEQTKSLQDKVRQHIRLCDKSRNNWTESKFTYFRSKVIYQKDIRTVQLI